MLLRSKATESSKFYSLPLTGRLFQQSRLLNANHSYNFFMKDPIVDWISNHIPTDSLEQNLFVKKLSEQGIRFEHFVITTLSKRSGISIPTVSPDNEITPELVAKTKRLMKQGCFAIHAAPLQDTRLGLCGVADLLVRSDKFHEFFGYTIPRDERYHPNRISNSYFYVVIDIKFRTFKLCVDKQTPYKSPKIDAFRDQLYTYSRLVGKFQGFTPDFAFLLGRQYDYKGDTFDYREKCFSKMLVRIDFTDESRRLSNEAIEWSKTVRKTNVPVRADMINLTNKTSVDKIKQTIAEKFGDVTQIWQCGPKHREILNDQGIVSIFDKRCTSKAMGFTGTRERIIQKILDLNQSENGPLVFIGDDVQLPVFEREFFIDFEHIPEPLMDTFDSHVCKRRGHLFMIGIGWESDNRWNYRVFKTDNTNITSERRLLQEVMDFLPTNATLYHWSHIEQTMWKRLLDAHNLKSPDYNWVDLAQIFIRGPIVIKGCFNFKLKNVAKAMKSYGMIETSMHGEVVNGTDCAAHAYQMFQSGDLALMPTLVAYNNLDCRMLWEILTYLRQVLDGTS